MPDLVLSEADISFVSNLTRKAGRLSQEMRKGVGIREKSGPNDLVTDADLAVSHLIIAALKQHFPEDLIVSEEDQHPVVEGGAEATLAAHRIWLIDPIDGTENYVKNDGQYTSMVGLLVDGVPHFGWMFKPAEDTLFAGGAGYGSFKQVGQGKPDYYKPSRGLLEKLPIRSMMGWGDKRKFPWVPSLPQISFVPCDLPFGLKIINLVEDEADLFVSLTGNVKLWDTAAPVAFALGVQLEAGTTDAKPLPYPVPRVKHGTSVIIGRPGALAWAQAHLHDKATHIPG